MFEDYQICPYTGLRSFTEEESLYFKGREEHIAMATEQLQRQKFLMLTGASGDGKSSLVYAGIIPNARAGFLKSKFSQWCVADFRPERTPFRNLAHAIAKQLDIPNPATAESELQHGFSALADLYKNSPLYPDMESVEWQQADDQQRNTLKRRAANLIILVDQFEEFFTNPENYHRGVPSRDSNLVLNLLLETARIALEQDLPIYVIFTMRSDYIGQCAAFRSLPEYIGFSQFFVPRLNRTQLQQVIEEPATLSGNRITRRLTERLIHDIAEGVDQLPILQHALNQIWHAAAKGKEEMDLLHYAMVGGMSPSELPDDQATRFKKWFDTLPAKIREFYREPNLQNVLDTHANKLYESAAESYRLTSGSVLSDETTKTIIKTAFTCLTKIDQSRAVRNRMTLAEITHLLNLPDISTATVGHVLQGFREPGNTFIRPFVTDDPKSTTLHPDDVLDITHESLIRNWEYLETWANEEFENYTISLDFEKQLNRWVDSGKSNGFLLSIGPLTYFENWYTKVKPNAWWIARYLPEDTDQSKKLEKAKVILAHADEFIRRSIRKHLVTRTVMKYGPGRIAAGLGIIGLLVLSSFAASNYFKRQNGYILESMKSDIFRLALSPKVNFYDKSTLLIEQILSGNSTLEEILDHIPDTLTKSYVTSRVAGALAFFGQGQPASEMLQAISQAEHHLSTYPYKKANVQQLTLLLNNTNYLRNGVALASVYIDTSALRQLRTQVASFSGDLVMHILNTQPEGFKEINHLNAALENAIHHKALGETDRKQLLHILSPFENQQRSPWVLKAYAVDNLAERGDYNYGFKFNGLYQQLAYLYAAEGNTSTALQCIDSLLAYNQNYFGNDYGASVDNATNIAMIFYVYDHSEALDAFIEGYCARKKISEVEFFQRLIGRDLASANLTGDLNEFGGGTLRNLNCQQSDEPALAYVFDRYRKTIRETIKSSNEQNFLLALSYKDEGMLRGNLRILRGEAEKTLIFQKLDTAFLFYQRVDPSYLLEEIRMANTNDIDAIQGPRNFLFLYPDYRAGFSVLEPRNIDGYYTSALFIEYLLQADLLNRYYSDQELTYFTRWLENIELDITLFANGVDGVCFAPDPKTLGRLEEVLSKRSASGNLDLNLLYFHLARQAFHDQDISRGLAYYGKINKAKLSNLLRNANGVVRAAAFHKIALAVTNLSASDSLENAAGYVRQFKNPINRSSLYAFAARNLLERKVNPAMSDRLLDSAKAELNRITNLATGQPNRQIIAHVLAMQDPEHNSEAAYAVIKNIGNKLDPTYRICRSFAFHGNLYGAQRQFLDNLSDQDHANFIWNILYGYRQGQQNTSPEWKNWTDNYNFNKTQTLFYINEAN